MSSGSEFNVSHEGSEPCTGNRVPADASKEALRMERIKAKNRRAQKKYREKKMQEVDLYKKQIKELNAKMRQITEEKKALQRDKARLEQIVQTDAAAPPQPSASQGPRSLNEVLEQYPFLYASREEQLQIHRGATDMLMQLFAAGADDESSPAHQQVLAVVNRMREVQMILVQMFPYKTARIKADVQQAAVKEVGPHTPALWQSVVAAARFTPLQRQQLLALRATFLREMDEVVAERRVLTQGIKAVLPHPGNMASFSSAMFKAQMSTSQLRANVEREYQLVTRFISDTLHHVVTPIQHARCIVAAAPHLPDILYISSQVYTEEAGLIGDPIDLLPDMSTICSDMSSYWWMMGQEPEVQGDSLWPSVYQGLDVYQEPSSGAMSPATPPPAASFLDFSLERGAGDSSAFANDELPTDAIAALLAADSLPLPDELNPCHTVEPGPSPTSLSWQ